MPDQSSQTPMRFEDRYSVNSLELLLLEQKSIAAKLDNLDRSVQELNLTFQQAEISRKRELELTQRLLDEDRRFSKDIVRQDRETVQKNTQRDIEKRETNRKVLINIGSSIWEKGGQWIVAALCFLIVVKLQSCAGGLDLIKLISVTK